MADDDFPCCAVGAQVTVTAHQPPPKPVSARSGTDTRSDMLSPQMGARPNGEGKR